MSFRSLCGVLQLLGALVIFDAALESAAIGALLLGDGRRLFKVFISGPMELFLKHWIFLGRLEFGLEVS